MATTEQRTGFRLPWASDARPGTSHEDQTPPAQDVSPAPDEANTFEASNAEATQMQDTTLSDPQAIGWPDADAAAGRSAPDAEAAAERLAPDDEPLAEAATSTASAAPLVPARPRRQNLLVTGLVRAMRDATTSAREETATRFAEEAKARVEAIHAQSADEAAELRKQADAEIVEIREFSKAEMTRIREETDQRIADRKRRLETEVDGHAARVEHRIEGVQVAVAEFERRMNTFFEALMSEEDPARLAGLAEQLPEPPSLDIEDLDEPTSAYDVPSFPMDVLDSRGAAAAEAEAFAGLDDSAEGDDDTTSTDDDGPADVIAEEDVARRLEAFTAHAASAAEPVVSSLAVVGLVSVASIAGFKRALAKTHGVHTVTVASGPSGDFVFSVTHDPEADLRSTVPSLDGFQAVITDDADGVLSITAIDPDGAH